MHTIPDLGAVVLGHAPQLSVHRCLAAFADALRVVTQVFPRGRFASGIETRRAETRLPNSTRGAVQSTRARRQRARRPHLVNPPPLNSSSRLFPSQSLMRDRRRLSRQYHPAHELSPPIGRPSLTRPKESSQSFGTKLIGLAFGTV